jgi:hypothetical protein
VSTSATLVASSQPASTPNGSTSSPNQSPAAACSDAERRPVDDAMAWPERGADQPWRSHRIGDRRAADQSVEAGLAPAVRAREQGRPVLALLQREEMDALAVVPRTEILLHGPQQGRPEPEPAKQRRHEQGQQLELAGRPRHREGQPRGLVAGLRDQRPHGAGVPPARELENGRARQMTQVGQ